MDTFKLRALVAVLDHRSVSAAASELAMTQSGVSMVLRRLEHHYGVRLVERRARGVAPTGAGEALYTYAKEVLRLEGVLHQQLEWERERSQGWVAIGSTPTIAGYILPPILAEFRRLHPGWQVSVETTSWPAMRDHILNRRLDFALMAGQTDLALGETLVRRERMLVVAAPNDPLAGQGAVEPSELLRRPFVLGGQDSDMSRLLETALGGPHGARLTTAIDALGVEAKKDAVRRGLGFGFLSEASVQRELRDGTLCEIPVAGVALTRPISLVHRKQGDLSPAATALFQAILEYR